MPLAHGCGSRKILWVEETRVFAWWDRLGCPSMGQCQAEGCCCSRGSDSLWKLLNEQEVIPGGQGRAAVWLQDLSWKSIPRDLPKLCSCPFCPITS